MNLYTVSIFLITYLICSINPAIEICKLKTGEDIRKLGSGNAGTTNAMRVLGKVLGSVVFILDIAKVFIAYGVVFGVGKIFSQDTTVTLNSVFLVAAVVGHCYPIYYKFKGGKGVVAGFVAILIINKEIAIVCLISAVLVIVITRIVSMGSLEGVILLDIMTIVMIREYIIPVLIVSAIIIFKHKNNIERIIQGQENKLF